jgi:hypothetical protein
MMSKKVVKLFVCDHLTDRQGLEKGMTTGDRPQQ